MTAPLVIVVSGLPGSGKTTLARTLGARLPAPVVERDRLAEVCFDALGPGSPAVGALGSVSYELLFHIAGELLRSRRSMVLESNFSRARHAARIRALVDGSAYRLAELHCRAPADVLGDRFAARARSGGRHPRHDDVNRIDEFRAVFADPARHEDALLFPELALVLDTAVPVRPDEVLGHLGRGRAGPDGPDGPDGPAAVPARTQPADGR